MVYGSEGRRDELQELGGRLQGETVTRFAAPADREFFAITRLRGRVFVGAGRLGIDVVEEGTVTTSKDNVYSFTLFANDEHLFASGLHEAARFVDEGWLASEFTH